jgi:hypothetical protein
VPRKLAVLNLRWAQMDTGQNCFCIDW